VERLREPCASVKYLVAGKEVGEKGTPHLQGFIYFKAAKSFSAVRKFFDNNHVEPAVDVTAAIKYCMKDGDYFEVGDKPLSAEDRCKRAREVVAARNKELLSCNLTVAVSSGLLSLNQVPVIKKAKSILALEQLPYEHDSVRGIWFWGPPGTGKSYTARSTYPGAFLKAQNKWFDGYQNEEAIILDYLDTDILGHYLKILAYRY